MLAKIMDIRGLTWPGIFSGKINGESYTVSRKYHFMVVYCMITRDREIKPLWAHVVTLIHKYINFSVTDSVAMQIPALPIKPDIVEPDISQLNRSWMW